MRRRELLLSAAVISAGIAALPGQANADTAFSSFAFNATGGNTPRTMPDRLADVVNVLDYGATGNGVTNDASAIQSALDAAFGSSASPHGSANATLNRPVFFPNGTYNLGSSTLNLTRVVGGHIYGAGGGATTITGTGTLLAINGASNCVIERISFTGGGSNSPLLNIDWDNTAGGGGLNQNVFRELKFSNFATAIVIAALGNDGADNLFQLCILNGSGVGSSLVGIEAHGTAAINNTVILGAINNCAKGVYCSGGSIHLSEPSLSANTFDLQVDSGLPVIVTGGRTESGFNSGETFLKLSSGLVTVNGFQQNVSAGKIANLTGGKASFTNMQSGCVFTGTGASSLYLRACSFSSGSLTTAYTSGGGTVVQNI